MVAVIAFVVNAFAQLSLKKNAFVTERETTFIKRNFTFYSVLAYFLFIIVTLCTLFALKKVRIMDMVYLAPISYLLVIVLSRLFFKEKITKHQILGVLVVLVGISVFNLNSVILGF